MKQYLTFSAAALNFAIESIYIREIFPLPELQAMAEAPGDVIGLLNLRGRLIPIIHLARRLGIVQASCHLQDSVILLEWQGIQVGVVVNQVNEVQEIADEACSSAIEFARDHYVSTALAHGFVQLEEQEELLTILHPESLIRQADKVAVLAWESELSQDDEAEPQALPSQNFYDLCHNVTATERQIFAHRALELKAPQVSYDISDLQPITVISISGQYFGVALDHVREFIPVPNLTRIPCSPRYILGNFNLRGEIITLLELSLALELPESKQRPKAIILEVDRQRIGVSVDEVHDVLYLAQEDYLEFPSTVSQEHHRFLTGAFEYQGEVVRLIDLTVLLDLFRPQAAMSEAPSSIIGA